MPQFVPRPGASSALASGEPIMRASAGGDGLGELAATAHPAVGNDRHVPTGLVEERIAGGGDVH